MTLEEAQVIFDACLSLPVICYAIAMGIGLILRVLRSAVE